MHYQARYYDPAIGRFISPDTIIPTASDPQDFNRYTYVKNGPLRYVDPTGRCVGNRSTPCIDGLEPTRKNRDRYWDDKVRESRKRQAVLQFEGRFEPVPGFGELAFSWYIPEHSVQRWEGNSRGPGRQPDPQNSKVTVFVNLDTGEVSILVTPSCSRDADQCFAPYDYNQFSVNEPADGLIEIDVTAWNSGVMRGCLDIPPLCKGYEIIVPPISADIGLDVGKGDISFVVGSTKFPDLEVFHKPSGATSWEAVDHLAHGREPPWGLWDTTQIKGRVSIN